MDSTNKGADGRDASRTTPSIDNTNIHVVLFTGRHLIYAAVVWPVLFCPLCFILFYSLHSRTAYDAAGVEQVATISAAGRFVPESLFFTYGLHLEALLLLFIFSMIHSVYRQRIDAFAVGQSMLQKNREEMGNSSATAAASTVAASSTTELCNSSSNSNNSNSNDVSASRMFSIVCCGCCISYASRNQRYLHYWNNTLYCMGIFCAFCMSAVGSITLEVNELAHGTFAFLMYFTAILHMLCSYYTIIPMLQNQQQQQQQQQRQRILHLTALFFCIPFNILMLVLAAIVISSCQSYHCRKFSADISPALEFSTTVALLVYIYRYVDDIGNIVIAQVLPSLSNSNNNNNNNSSDNNSSDNNI